MIFSQILQVKNKESKDDYSKPSLSLLSSFGWLVCILLLSSCDSSSPTLPTTIEEEIVPTETAPVTQQSTIAFYNVENLFDPEDDTANPRDDEFLPVSQKMWTKERYAQKLENIGEVIQGMNFPIILGLAEVENKQVLEDLIAIPALKEYAYEIVHQESPDYRGIDVALLYQADQFSLQDWETFSVAIDDPNISNYTTRDILLVTGELNKKSIHILVNHWPSRSGGTAKTEFRRITAATHLQDIVANLQQQTPTSNIVLMGDFNDEPTNKSISEVLNVQPINEEPIPSQLYNCTSSLDELQEGSYNYQGNWQMLDQIMATGSLLASNTPVQLQNFQVYKSSNLLFMHPQYGLSPNRTYSGDNYIGGHSDHLPVFMEIGQY